MPYIKKEKREEIDKVLVYFDSSMEAGELTYIIYKLLLKRASSSMYYSELASCIGILESAKQEFYRRVVAPYEDKKIIENGDVV
jgi:hypothetical protein